MRRPPFIRLLPVAIIFGIAAAGSARAESIPGRAVPPSRAVPCAALGRGYRAVAGTSTCLRVTGSVSVEAVVASGGADHRPDVGAFMAVPRR